MQRTGRIWRVHRRPGCSGSMMIEINIAVAIVLIILAILIGQFPRVGWPIAGLLFLGVVGVLISHLLAARSARAGWRQTLERIAAENALSVSHRFGDAGGFGHIVGVDESHRKLVFVNKDGGQVVDFDAVRSVQKDASYRLGSSVPSAHLVVVQIHGRQNSIHVEGGERDVADWFNLLNGMLGKRDGPTDPA